MMKKMGFINKKMNNLKIKRKLLLAYIFSVFIPVFILGLFLTNAMREMALNGAVREATSNVDRLKKRVAEALEVPVHISNKLYTEQKLISLLSRRYADTLDVVKAYWEFTDVDTMLNDYKGKIQGIRFYVNNNTTLKNWYIVDISQGGELANWYNGMMKNMSKFAWDYSPQPIGINQVGNYIGLTRKILEERGRRTVGLLKIMVEDTWIQNIFKQESFESMLINDQGVVVSAKDPHIIGKTETEIALWNGENPKTSGIFDTNYKKTPSKVIVDTFSMEGSNQNFKIVSVFSVDHILSPSKKASMFGFTLLAISMVLSLSTIFIFSDMLSRRIRRISTDMHTVAAGDLNYIPRIDGQDEIGQLAGDLDKMVKSINELIREVYIANSQKNEWMLKQKEIKLQMLASQMNPHFLFNALETIRMKAHCKGESEIANVVKMLGSLLRKSLEAGSNPVPLATELQLVENYLNIQKFRFGDKLDYHICTSGISLEQKVLPFILQPVVENAVIHGIEGKVDRAEIHINIINENRNLIITILDNGIGMDTLTLQQIVQYLQINDDSANGRIGLRNVNQRIKLYYGEEYGLKIQSVQNEGTTVQIMLPGIASTKEGS